jgi:GTP-binding protein
MIGAHRQDAPRESGPGQVAEQARADGARSLAGAHDGAGLGIRFLGHVERCRVLLHLVDGTEPDVAAAYATVRREIAAYDGGLAERPEIRVLNKADAVTDAEIAERRAALAAAAGGPVLVASGVSGRGVSEVLRAVMAPIAAARAPADAEPTPYAP